MQKIKSSLPPLLLLVFLTSALYSQTENRTSYSNENISNSQTIDALLEKKKKLKKEIERLKSLDNDIDRELERRRKAYEDGESIWPLSENARNPVKEAIKKYAGGFAFSFGYNHLDTKEIALDIERPAFTLGGMWFSIIFNRVFLGFKGVGFIIPSSIRNGYEGSIGYGLAMIGIRANIGFFDLVPVLSMGGGGYNFRKRVVLGTNTEGFPISEKLSYKNAFFIGEFGVMLNFIISDYITLGLYPYINYTANTPLKTFGVEFIFYFGRFKPLTDNNKSKNERSKLWNP